MEVHVKSISLLLILFLIFTMPKTWAQDELEPGEEDFLDGPNSDHGNEDSDIPSGVRLGNPTYGGNGCPNGTARAILSPDSKTLSILFDHFETRAGGTLAKKTVADCSLRVPISVPLNFQAMVTRLDYRGFAYAPQQGRAVLKANYQVIRGDDLSPVNKIIKRRKQFQGPVNNNFTAVTRFRLNRFDLKCGESFILKMGTRVVAVANNRNEETMMTLDSIDQTANVLYALRWKRCH
jgi:hypothetical protein